MTVINKVARLMRAKMAAYREARRHMALATAHGANPFDASKAAERAAYHAGEYLYIQNKLVTRYDAAPMQKTVSEMERVITKAEDIKARMQAKALDIFDNGTDAELRELLS